MKEMFKIRHLDPSWRALAIMGTGIWALSILGPQFVPSEAWQQLVVRLQDMLSLTLSVILGAFPFLVLGVAVSTLVALFVKEKWVVQLLPRGRWTSHFVVSFLGMLMPVCECGNIPVGRRLLVKGFTVSQTVSFLLAAPVINLVTIASTAEAFVYDPAMVWLRVFASLIIAYILGLLISFAPSQTEFLTPALWAEVCSRDTSTSVKNKLRAAVSIYTQEFLAVMKLLAVGAVVAAVIQTLIPRDSIVALGADPFLSVIAMVALGFIISVCSSVDAFFALSLAGSFSRGALLAFLITGPMIDLKILTLLRDSFRPKLLILITLFVVLSGIAVGLFVNLVI